MITMASPQVENGYLKVANELWEALTRVRLTDKERRVVMAVIRKTYGHNKCRDEISLGQIAEETGLYRQRVAEALSSLEKRNIITICRETYVNRIGIQKDYERWDSTSPQTRTGPGSRTSPQTRTETVTLSRTHKRQKTYIPVFEHWNSKGIIKHRALTAKMERAINGRLREGYTLEDITGAIDSYAVVVSSPEYFFSYRWTLTDFLTRGLDRFVDDAKPLENFRKDKARVGTCKNAGAPYPRSEMTESTLEACDCPDCHAELERRNEDAKR